MECKPILQGAQIFLREVRVEDVNDSYYGWLNDPIVTRFMNCRLTSQSKENILSYVKALDGKKDEPFFAICLNDSKKHIGNIKLGPIDWFNKKAEVSIMIGDKDSWQKGYATEAIRLVGHFAFKVLNLHRLYAGCHVPNVASAKSFEKAGWTKEAVLRKALFLDGEYVDHIFLGMLESEYTFKGEGS